MKLYLCHTPLHLLLSAISRTDEADEESLFIVVEDTPCLHAIAREFLKPAGAELLLLPGNFSARSPKDALSVQKANASTIRRNVSGLSVGTAAIFYDLRAEAQALLNYSLNKDTLVSCIEDGLMLYDVARPFSRSLMRRWKNKLRFGIKWKEARFIGQHPAINEFRCLFPRMLREDLRRKPHNVLPHRLESRFEQQFQVLYGGKQYERPFGIIVLPHPETRVGREHLFHFIELGLSRCSDMGIDAIFKIHPRDSVTHDILTNAFPGCRFVSQQYPIELVLYVEPHARLLMGIRTSALHVTKALHKHVECFYFEPEKTDPAAPKWRSFFRSLGIAPLDQIIQGNRGAD